MLQFSITISGEAPELSSALQTLKSTLEGHQLTSGAVTASVTPGTSNPNPTSVPTQPVQNPYPTQPPYTPATDPGYQPQPGQPGYPPQPGQQQMQPVQQPGYGQPVPTQQPNMQQPQQGYNPGQAPSAGVPTTETLYTLDQLAQAAARLMESGKQDQLFALLGSFGVQALTALPKEQYGVFATHLRGLGAAI